MVESEMVELERDLVYTLLRGRDVAKWSAQFSILYLDSTFTRSGSEGIPRIRHATLEPKSFYTYITDLLGSSGLVRRYFTH